MARECLLGSHDHSLEYRSMSIDAGAPAGDEHRSRVRWRRRLGIVALILAAAYVGIGFLPMAYTKFNIGSVAKGAADAAARDGTYPARTADKVADDNMMDGQCRGLGIQSDISNF